MKISNCSNVRTSKHASSVKDSGWELVAVTGDVLWLYVQYRAKRRTTGERLSNDAGVLAAWDGSPLVEATPWEATLDRRGQANRAKKVCRIVRKVSRFSSTYSTLYVLQSRKEQIFTPAKKGYVSKAGSKHPRLAPTPFVSTDPVVPSRYIRDIFLTSTKALSKTTISKFWRSPYIYSLLSKAILMCCCKYRRSKYELCSSNLITNFLILS